MDGRPLPVDPMPTFNGAFPVGAWDGDVLVVTSHGFRDGTWLDRNGSPMSDNAKLTERFRRQLRASRYRRYARRSEGLYAPCIGDARQRLVLDTELRLPLHRQRKDAPPWSESSRA